jgi:hypothetical protein
VSPVLTKAFTEPLTKKDDEVISFFSISILISFLFNFGILETIFNTFQLKLFSGAHELFWPSKNNLPNGNKKGRY